MESLELEVGPNTVPWGTPDFTGSVLDAWLSKTLFDIIWLATVLSI